MRKKPIYFMLGLMLSTVFMLSCGEDRSGEYYALIGSKTWIYETMQQNYLFYEDLPAEDGLDFSISLPTFWSRLYPIRIKKTE